MALHTDYSKHNQETMHQHNSSPNFNQEQHGNPRMNESLLAKVERLVDEKYLSLELPHLDWSLVAWYLLTSLEDHEIWMFRSAAKDDSLRRSLENLTDRMKYSIKHALLRARSEIKTDSNHKLPRKVVPILYRRASKIIEEGVGYSTAIQIISSVYEKKISLASSGDSIKIEVLDDIYHDISYSVLEVIGHIEPETITYSLIFYSWLCNKDETPLAVRLITESVSLKNRILQYKYNPGFAYGLAQSLSQQPYLIPDDWEFEWGGRTETTLLLNSLAIRCMYHLVAVDFGARKYDLKGGGEESLVLVLTREQLVTDLIEMSSLEDSTVGIFVDCLTFGNRVDVPDPALQPFIKLSGGRFALPCLHIITSHLERNLLSLQARQAPKKFDSQSNLFEIKMTNEIIFNIKEKWPTHKANIHATLAGHTEELDLVIVDQDSKSLFIGELRWMLPPGDPREVQNRKKECGKKVKQLQRKIKFIKDNVACFMENYFKIKVDKTWDVYGAVIIEGFGGAKSTDPNLPVIIKYIAELGLENSNSIRQFGTWCSSGEWLPQDGTHYDRGHDRIETNEESIEYSTIGTLCTPYEYREFLTESLKRFS